MKFFAAILSLVIFSSTAYAQTQKQTRAMLEIWNRYAGPEYTVKNDLVATEKDVHILLKGLVPFKEHMEKSEVRSTHRKDTLLGFISSLKAKHKSLSSFTDPESEEAFLAYSKLAAGKGCDRTTYVLNSIGGIITFSDYARVKAAIAFEEKKFDEAARLSILNMQAGLALINCHDVFVKMMIGQAIFLMSLKDYESIPDKKKLSRNIKEDAKKTHFLYKDTIATAFWETAQVENVYALAMTYADFLLENGRDGDTVTNLEFSRFLFINEDSEKNKTKENPDQILIDKLFSGISFTRDDKEMVRRHVPWLRVNKDPKSNTFPEKRKMEIVKSYVELFSVPDAFQFKTLKEYEEGLILFLKKAYRNDRLASLTEKLKTKPFLVYDVMEYVYANLMMVSPQTKDKFEGKRLEAKSIAQSLGWEK
ncbi:MAG: hypothetical protein AB7O96_01235 [Pseudobdellovibrionaceae bacterium]